MHGQQKSASDKICDMDLGPGTLPSILLKRPSQAASSIVSKRQENELSDLGVQLFSLLRVRDLGDGTSGGRRASDAVSWSVPVRLANVAASCAALFSSSPRARRKLVGSRLEDRRLRNMTMKGEVEVRGGHEHWHGRCQVPQRMPDVSGGCRSPSDVRIRTYVTPSPPTFASVSPRLHVAWRSLCQSTIPSGISSAGSFSLNVLVLPSEAFLTLLGDAPVSVSWNRHPPPREPSAQIGLCSTTKLEEKNSHTIENSRGLANYLSLEEQSDGTNSLMRFLRSRSTETTAQRHGTFLERTNVLASSKV